MTEEQPADRLAMALCDAAHESDPELDGWDDASESTRDLYRSMASIACAHGRSSVAVLGGAGLIAREQLRRVEDGWTADADDQFDSGELLAAARCYGAAAVYVTAWPEHRMPPWVRDATVQWPWDEDEWEPATTPSGNLAKAGALIAAEMGRIARADAPDGTNLAVEWVESITGRSLSSELVRCVEVLCAIGQPKDLPLIEPGWYGWWSFGHMVLDDSFAGVGDDELGDGELEVTVLDDASEAAVPVRRAVEFGPGESLTVRLRAGYASLDDDALQRLMSAGSSRSVAVVCSIERYAWPESADGPAGSAKCLRIDLVPAPAPPAS